MSRRSPARSLVLLSCLIAGLTPAAARAFTLPVTGPPDSPRMVFDNHMQVVSVCLPVTNPQGGRASSMASASATAP